MNCRSRVLILGLLLMAAACSPGRSGTENVSPADAPVRVEATNRFALPVEIYAVGAGMRYRLGMVHPGMVAVFKVPPAMVGGGQVEFHASPTASAQAYRSGGLLLSPGVIVDLVIAAQLFASTAVIRP